MVTSKGVHVKGTIWKVMLMEVEWLVEERFSYVTPLCWNKMTDHVKQKFESNNYGNTMAYMRDSGRIWCSMEHGTTWWFIFQFRTFQFWRGVMFIFLKHHWLLSEPRNFKKISYHHSFYTSTYLALQVSINLQIIRPIYIVAQLEGWWIAAV